MKAKNELSPGDLLRLQEITDAYPEQCAVLLDACKDGLSAAEFDTTFATFVTNEHGQSVRGKPFGFIRHIGHFSPNGYTWGYWLQLLQYLTLIGKIETDGDGMETIYTTKVEVMK